MPIGQYSDEQVAQFVQANKDNPAAIAQQAAAMGLNQDQIQQALQIGGVNVSNDYLTNQAQNLGYNFGGTGGDLQQVASPVAFDDNRSAQQAGIVDPWQRREAILQARAANPQADELSNQFSLYKQYNPSGAFANDYAGWVADQNPATLNAMRAGTYTGTPTAPRDWAPGGIYGPGTGHDVSFEQSRYGLGAHGANDGWNAWTGAAGESKPAPMNNNVAGWNAQGGSNGMESGVLTTKGGQQVRSQQLRDFAATNPNDQQIMAEASRLGMNMDNLGVALNNLGLLFNNGDPRSMQMNDSKNGSLYNRLSGSAFQGSTGYGIANNPSGGFNDTGLIVAGNGHTWDDANKKWDRFGNNTTGYATPGTFENPMGSPAVMPPFVTYKRATPAKRTAPIGALTRVAKALK